MPLCSCQYSWCTFYFWWIRISRSVSKSCRMYSMHIWMHVQNSNVRYEKILMTFQRLQFQQWLGFDMTLGLKWAIYWIQDIIILLSWSEMKFLLLVEEELSKSKIKIIISRFWWRNFDLDDISWNLSPKSQNMPPIYLMSKIHRQQLWSRN